MPLLSAGRARPPIDSLATPSSRPTRLMWGPSRQLASGLTATARLIHYLSTLFPSGPARLVPVAGFGGVKVGVCSLIPCHGAVPAVFMERYAGCC
jgi:hypothetical protein